jgi:hypothetical protein
MCTAIADTAGMETVKTFTSHATDPRPTRSRVAPVLTASLMTALLFTSGEQLMALEKPTYELLDSEGRLELRRYEPHIVAETFVEADFERAGNEGFRRLADYIFGNNRSRQKISMTAPVAQAASEKIAMTAPVSMHRDAGRYRITFMMPSEYTMATLPEPVDPEIRLREVPSNLVAAIRYSGTWSEQRYEAHRVELEAWIDARGWKVTGEPIFARYDPPFKPWFLRRNEILILLEEGGGP